MDHKELNSFFAEAIRQCRKARAMSAAEFAELLEIGKTSVLNIEKNRANVTLNTVQSAADHLHMPPLTLLGEYDPVKTAVSSLTLECLNGVSQDALNEVSMLLLKAVNVLFLDMVRRQNAEETARINEYEHL